MRIRKYGSRRVHANLLTGSCYRVGDTELSKVIVSIYSFAIGRAVPSEDPGVTLATD
jgi:hypothetical protein